MVGKNTDADFKKYPNKYRYPPKIPRYVRSGYRSLVRRVTDPKGHWSDIYAECNDQVNIIT